MPNTEVLVHPRIADSEYPEVPFLRQGQNLMLPARMCNDIQGQCHSSIFCKLQGPGFVLGASHTDVTVLMADLSLAPLESNQS